MVDFYNIILDYKKLIISAIISFGKKITFRNNITNLGHYTKTSFIYHYRIISFVEPLLVLLAAMGLIAAATGVWIPNLDTTLCSHWDVGLHAWKLNWNARHILEGGVFFPNYHANIFYPLGYTLALDDLFWVPSYFAAFILAISQNPILT